MIDSPSGVLDQKLVAQHGWLAGVDEVGRGCLAGPLAVGVVVIDADCEDAPAGIADSKLLRPEVRKSLVTPIQQWARASAVGWSSPTEISGLGLTESLRRAALRAFGLVHIQMKKAPGAGHVLLDGNHDWISRVPAPDLFGEDAGGWADPFGTPVSTLVKADRSSQVVAAASILAKVMRDTYMESIYDPGYSWASNKGYASPDHLAAVASIGLSGRHRLGWKLGQKG